MRQSGRPSAGRQRAPPLRDPVVPEDVSSNGAGLDPGDARSRPRSIETKTDLADQLVEPARRRARHGTPWQPPGRIRPLIARYVGAVGPVLPQIGQTLAAAPCASSGRRTEEAGRPGHRGWSGRRRCAERIEIVELAGIEPASSSAEPGLLRVQSVRSLFSAPALARTRAPTGSVRKKSRSTLLTGVDQQASWMRPGSGTEADARSDPSITAIRRRERSYCA